MRKFGLFMAASLLALLLVPFGLAEEDTDGDGMSDSWEIEYGLDPDDPVDAHGDMDGDGFSNLAEYEADTDPFNCNFYPGMEDRTLTLTVGLTNFGIIRAGENRTFPVTVSAFYGHFDDVHIEVADPGIFEVSVQPNAQDISRDSSEEFIITVHLPEDSTTGDVAYSISIKAVGGDIESSEERIYFGEEGELEDSPGFGIAIFISAMIITILISSIFLGRRRSEMYK